MSRLKKYVILAVAVVVMAALVTGIAFYTASYDPSNPETGVYLNGKKVLAADDVVLTIGDYDITYAEYRYYYFYTRDYTEMMAAYTGGTAPDWDNDPDGDYAADLRETVESDLVYVHAWIAIAEARGLAVTEEEHTENLAQIQTQKDELGEAAFVDQMNQAGLVDEETYIMIMEKQQLMQKGIDAVREEIRAEISDEVGDAADAEYEATYITAKHILFMSMTDAEYTALRAVLEDEGTEDDSSAADDSSTAGDSSTADDSSTAGDSSAVDEEAAQAAYEAQAQEETLARAEYYLSLILNSADPAATFDEIMNERSEDGGLETNPNGYTFAEGEMVSVFYEGAKALAVGEISQPIWHGGDEASYMGYHIIMRMPLDESGMAEHRETAVSNAVEEEVTVRSEAQEAIMAVTTSQYYMDINLQTMV